MVNLSEKVTEIKNTGIPIHPQEYDPTKEELQQEYKHCFFHRMKSAFSNGERVSKTGLFLLARKENQYV